uniref:Uncharacterized protein n=1 Tax=Arundo donax TaxID=35708 RepID=A0A0A9FCE8_ARUDO
MTLICDACNTKTGCACLISSNTQFASQAPTYKTD